MTIPNLLSFLRLLLIPVFLTFLLVEEYLLALIILVLSSTTDFVDGFIARRFNQVSRLGQLLDPAADRLFIFSTLIGLAWSQIIPWWLAGVIFARELLLVILGVMLANHGFGPMPSHHLGKMGTFALLTAMPIFVVGAAFPAAADVANAIAWATALWGVFLYWWAGIIYALEAGRLIRLPMDAAPAASDSLDF
ncbi:MAG TPA: CDP-alcohol phosphatidyltransferase family protein [Pseudolysinimonas sp.]|nr:CDP-alcohol phosphatidyltransferase family protein [Pseudolysinimonas sp.]